MMSWDQVCRRESLRDHSWLDLVGIKEYSDWPTIPQLYVNKEFVGGCDILMQMHKDGSLADMLSQNKLIVEEEGQGDVEGQKAQETRETTEQSTGARSKDAKGESS